LETHIIVEVESQMERIVIERSQLQHQKPNAIARNIEPEDLIIQLGDRKVIRRTS
jgi:hypothetical protein